MHVLYFPLVCEDASRDRPDPRWARRIVRESSSGWRCAVLFRPSDNVSEAELWDRTRTVIERVEICARESAETAFLFAQRLIKALQGAGLDGPVAYRFAVIVSDGRKLHVFLRGFRAVLWGVPLDGASPLRLAAEEKQNVIESRDLPALQPRGSDAPWTASSEPILAVVDRVEPDGLLNAFTRSLESFLIMSGGLATRRAIEQAGPSDDRALWQLWEEVNNLAAVDLRRLEARLHLAGPGGPPSATRAGAGNSLRRLSAFALPAALGLCVALLIAILVLVAGGRAPRPPAASPAPGAEAAEPSSLLVGGVLPGMPVADAGPTDAGASPDARAPKAIHRIALFVRDSGPTDRIHFTRPVRLFVERRVEAILKGEALSTRTHRTLLDVAAQILANRVCHFDTQPVPVDGEVGEATLGLLQRCGREVGGIKDLVLAYRQPASDPVEVIERLEPLVQQLIADNVKPQP